MRRSWRTCALLGAAMAVSVGATQSAWANSTTVIYDSFTAPYSLSDYQAKWTNSFGLGDMAQPPGDTRSFSGNAFHINDAPFRTAADFSVFDHLKYIATSNQSFPVPGPGGSLTFASTITAETPGTQSGRVVHGTYGPPGSYPNGRPYAARVFEGQQAGAVMNMINFQTGQLFDWFISGTRAFTLVERLPSSVINPTLDPSSPDWVGPGKMYTQIVNEFPVRPGPHRVAILYARSLISTNGANVIFLLDGHVASIVTQVGMPLDSPDRAFPIPWTHVYSSATYPGGAPAQGEQLGGKIQDFTIGHGTFSLVDAFPFQWGWAGGSSGLTCTGTTAVQIATCNSGSVSIPASERLFGQGVNARFDDFTVTTTTR